MIAEHTGDDIYSAHATLKYNFAGREKINGLVVGKSTASMTNVEHIEYWQKIRTWAFNFLDLLIPEPEKTEL